MHQPCWTWPWPPAFLGGYGVPWGCGLCWVGPAEAGPFCKQYQAGTGWRDPGLAPLTSCALSWQVGEDLYPWAQGAGGAHDPTTDSGPLRPVAPGGHILRALAALRAAGLCGPCPWTVRPALVTPVPGTTLIQKGDVFICKYADASCPCCNAAPGQGRAKGRGKVAAASC